MNFDDKCGQQFCNIEKKLHDTTKVHLNFINNDDEDFEDLDDINQLNSEYTDFYEIYQKKLVNKEEIDIDSRSNRELYKERTATFMDNYSKYNDSRIFLKGLTTQNIQNDYSQHYVDTGKRGQNYIRDISLDTRFNAYPRLRELLRLKDELTEKRNTPAFFLKVDLRKFNLSQLNNTFDVILIDPPLEEYKILHPIIHQDLDTWSWDEIKGLNMKSIVSSRSFIFMWCGSKDGLEKGRECFKEWGFRRCEDICWVKSNRYNTNHITPHIFDGKLLKNQKEHLLMGIKGSIRRNSDVHFIHTNIDLDVIVTEEPPYGSIEKPDEAFRLIEHFCLSRKRIYLFGNQNSTRNGWVFVGKHVQFSNYDSDHYNSYLENDGVLIGSTPEIEQLRPKSPILKRPVHTSYQNSIINTNPFFIYRS